MAALLTILAGILCAFGVRWAAFRLLPKSLSWLRYLVAYGCWFMVVVVCVAVIGFSGMPLYGFDSSNAAHMTGYTAMWLGMLVVVGAPFVLLLDVVVAVARLPRRA